MRLLEFLEEENGQLSNTRLNSTLMIWVGIAILIGGAFKMSGATLDANTLAAAFGLISAGAGQKLVQKSMEVKQDASPSGPA